MTSVSEREEKRTASSLRRRPEEGEAVGTRRVWVLPSEKRKRKEKGSGAYSTCICGKKKAVAGKRGGSCFLRGPAGEKNAWECCAVIAS